MSVAVEETLLSFSRELEQSSIAPQCLKITEKVSFNITSEASYVYILNWQKLIKNVKNDQFWRVFENLKLAVKQCKSSFTSVGAF